MMKPLIHLLRVDRYSHSHREKIISSIGGGLGIFCIILISIQAVGGDGAVYIIPSLGASAVLLFAVPHSPLGQPWNLFGGHLISAAMGVACAQLIPTTELAAAAAVGLAIGSMYYAKCIHPPGGATALAAVIGGSAIQDLGFSYLITPVLINVLVIFLMGILFNYPFEWRRYPITWFKKSQEANATSHYEPVSHEQLVYALSEIDTIVDVSEEDLLQIYKLATGRRVPASSTPSKPVN